MELEDTIPDCVRARQLEESFINRRERLAGYMDWLKPSLDSLTIRQLKAITEGFESDKEEIHGCIEEYRIITDTYPQEVKKLLISYDEAIRRTKEYINRISMN